MTADSSGVEWASIVKPILAASYGSFNKNDVTELVKAIVKSEPDLLNHEEQYETFYTSFAALAADYISSSISSVCKGQLGLVCSAARILLQYLLSRLQLQATNEPPAATQNPITAKHLLLPIKALCTGTGQLCRGEQIVLTNLMKNAKLPPHIKTSLPGDKETTNLKDSKSKSRSDLSAMIAEQLMTPLHDFAPQKVITSEPADIKTSDTNTTETHQDTELIFTQKNTACLQSMNAGDILVEMCMNLPQLMRYRNKFISAINKKGFSLPSTHTEALLVRHSLQVLVNDINMVWSALSLPVLEPLTDVKMEKLSTITMSCLYAAVSIATANSILGISSAVSPKTAMSNNTTAPNPAKPGEEEGNLDALAVSVVERSLEIFNLISNVFKNSTRAGGHILQNHLLLGVWLLVTGLQSQLSTSSLLPSDKGSKEDKGKSPSKSRDGSSRINLMKVQQGFGVLSVALACRALTMMSALLDDLQVECNDVSTEPSPAQLHILSFATALQRAARVLTSAPLNQFLFYLATVSYRKACTLKRIQKHPPEGDTFSTSDSTTYYDDDIISCSEESSPDEDDDSEPLLGLWFEETIAVPDTSHQTQSGQEVTDPAGKTNNSQDTGGSIVPEKGEPNGYISLASQIFQFMNKYLLNSESPYIQRYVESGLAEQQMVILAAIIRDLDRETARTETGTISVYFGAVLGVLYSEFSQALTRYTHNLLARTLLSDTLQTTLLHHLGISPVQTADANNNAWPLQVYPRTLAVLAQILLLKPQTEKETLIINIWNRLIHTLVENITNYNQAYDADNEDMNVEHAQLLLFLFHSLNLMQKKSVLLACASGIIRVGESSVRGLMRETQLLCLSRLLLLFEYMMKHLYDAPPVLLQQVQWNLFNATSMVGDTVQGRAPARIFCVSKEIEDNYRKLGPQDEFSMKPRFYSIVNHELNNQEHPKLDGLACNFIMGSAEKVKYPLLMDVLIEILNITDQTIPSIKSTENKISFTALTATQYCFSICWRLLLQLPPSTPYLDKLALGQGMPASPLLLHSLVWGPRAGHKFFSSWMKDNLVKQGMYTQYAENLLKSVADTVNNPRYDVTLAKNCIVSLMPHIQTEGWLVPKRDLPSVMELCLMDTVIAKVQALTDDTPAHTHSSSTPDLNKSFDFGEPSPHVELAQDLLPHVLRLTEVILACSRTSLMYQINESSEASGGYSLGDFIVFRCVLAVSSSRSVKTQSLSAALTVLLPTSVKTALDKWNANAVTDFPSNTYANDIIPGESYVLAVVNAHISSLSSQQTFTINPSLKHLLHSLVSFISEHIMKCEETNVVRLQAVQVLAPLTLDACTEYLHDIALRTLERTIGDPETEAHQVCIYNLVLQNIYTLIINYTDATSICSDAVNEKLLQECLSWMEGLLDKQSGRKALDQFFEGSKHDLMQILLSIASPRTCKSTMYSTKVLQFFNKLFNAAEKSTGDIALERLRASVLNLATVESNQLRNWLRHVILGSPKLPSSAPVEAPPSSSSSSEAFPAPSPVTAAPPPAKPVVEKAKTEAAPRLLQENQLLLQYLTLYIISENSENDAKEDVAVTLLEALIPIGSQLLSTAEGVGFKELMVVMATLADAGSGRGHLQLFMAAVQWLDICKQNLCNKEVLTQLVASSVAAGSMVEATCYIVNYTSDVISALCPSVGGRASSPPWDGDTLPPSDLDTDWMDELGHDDDEESGGDDSDEDSLCNKLCTFTITQKEFMNQHWYHCHTCKMVDSVGVCTVCARVCHRNHDVTYAKYGNFFCDCGAKENGSCQALVKRSPQLQQQDNLPGQASSTTNTGNMGMELTSSLRRRPSSPTLPERGGEPRSLPRDKHRIATLAKQLDVFSETLTSMIWKEGSIIGPLLELLQSLMPAVEAACTRQSPVGCYHRAQSALEQLHTLDKKFETTDQLMVPTLGSQEGAFENVRMNYTGDQGQTIRQLLSAHMIRRVAMCCLSSPYGKRQHLAVSNEKGKITVLQLSALLKQADSSKRKLTLTRLSSAPIPFTVLSLTGNPWNEDFLAVCGLRDCHILTFHPSGSVGEHLVLHPQLETGNFIIRAIWLPGSQTVLALVTADFVKIYDLGKDVLSPQYYFLVPTGKIRDVTFICPQDEKPTMLLMSSTGYIYSQDMDDDSSAKHGPFYVTNTLDISHSEIKDVNGSVCAGGVSVYYSHTLQLLFFSYAQGKSFIAPVKARDCSLGPVFHIQLARPAATGPSKANNATASQPQPLCQWSEVPNHPGLVCSVMQTSNNPVILMVKPETVLVQEIKVVPVKTKIMDTVAIRHPSSGSDHRTTLILLCEDGSLRIYMAAMDQTGYWLSPGIQPVSTMSNLKSAKKKKTPKVNKSPGAVTFPVDFFEHSTLLNDVEFGGNDLLQIYNAQQIKNRLNTAGMYVVSTKSTGFNIEINNNDGTHVITGIRVLLGNQDVQRVPGYIEVSGRTTQTTVARNRWFDLPLTREESLQADKKLTVTFGPSQDPEGVTMVDSVKVYGKSKDQFGWPEETEEVTSNTVVPTPAAAGTSAEATDTATNFPPTITSLDKVVCGILEVLDSTILLMSGDQHSKVPVSTLTSLVSYLLILPTATCVQRHVKSVLAALHPTRQSYHNYKDQVLLSFISKSLAQLRQVENAKDLDAEAFYRLVLMTRAIAVTRPQNLAKSATYEASASDSQNKGPENSKELLHQLTEIMWKLHAVRPANSALASVCVPGLTHVEATIHCIVEMIHSYTLVDGSDSTVSLAVKLYLTLLLCPDTTVSFSAKQAFIRVLRPRLKRRRVFIPSPPHCSTPGQLGAAESEKAGPVSQPSQESSDADQAHFEVDTVEPMVLLAPDAGAGAGVPVNMEVLLGAGGFPPLLDIPPDADDETMVELAIALSLQDHEGAANLQSITHGLANLHNLAGPALQVLATQGLGQVQNPAGANQEGGHYSDTTASAGASDDEGSTAATDGSTLRTSPAEQGDSESGGSGVESITGEHNYSMSGRSSAYGDNIQENLGGSESGGSGVDSITGEHNYSMSGRSSAYGDNIQENLVGARSETSSLGAPAGFQNQEPDGTEAEAEVDTESGIKLHDLRLSILEKLIQFVPKLSEVGGVRAIPFMQVVLMLTSDLDGNEERDRACLENLLTAVIGELSMRSPDMSDVCKRTPQREVHLVIMRLISVLMSRSKSSSKFNTDNCGFISQVTATMLQQAGVIDYCLQLLKQFLSFWKATVGEELSGTVGGGVLKPHLNMSPPDMSPFFLKQYVKGHSNDVFKDYPQLLTEMALRLPYQVQKHSCTPITFEQAWFYYLCEYMMTQQAPFIRRHVRKLLLFICGTKEKYRQLRDLHSLGSHIKAVQQCCDNGGFSVGGNHPFSLSLSYDALVELIEHLKACVEVASARIINWQLFCLRHETILSFLLQVSCLLDEVVAQTILQLLQCAICPPAPQASQSDKSAKNSNTGSSGGSGGSGGGGGGSGKTEKEGGEPSEEANNCAALVKQLNKCVERDLLTRFIRTFLLDTNNTNVRWQAHALVVAIYKNSDKGEQETVLDLMWSLWPNLPTYGRKAVQFVDLLGYFSIKCTSVTAKMNEYIEQAVGVLHNQNQLLSHHPNANLYAHLAQYVELDGFYLESEPCLVCNNPEVPFSSIKLSSIKIDSKFTTTTQIVKLVGSHTISKITLRIGDLKRTKMVRTINIYYNNRTVQAVVELKNKPAMWHKAKKVSLVSGQTEVKIEFPLPIVACNLMIEYADFYENLQASSESLQCPRCSSSVPANPGVCANCGENVFQCHKCRAINYDEKDPFLCHACGFCKYAKFDYTLTGRPCCAVDPIENDEDRKKAIATINSHLEKADRVYKQLVGNKPTLEMLLVKISEHRLERSSEDSNSQPGNSTAVVNQVNRAIQLLAQRYCGDCKNSFEELSRIIQRVHACRRELVAYDRQQLEQSRGGRSGSSGASGSRHDSIVPTASAGRCYGCASAATEHCLTLLRALAVTPSSRKILCAQGLIQELVEFNLRKGTVQVQEEVRQLLCMVTRDNPEATESLCSLIMERISVTMRGHGTVDLGYSVRPEIALLAALIQKEDSCWELKLRSVMQLFLMASKDNKSPVVMESVLLPCLKILQSLIKPDQPGSKKNKDKTLDVLATLRPTEGVHIDRNKWLERDPNHTFEAWRRRMYSKDAEIPPAKPSTKEEVRAHYLMEKYAKRWRERTISPVQPLRLSDSAWLKCVLFNSSSRLARQVACNMLESICQVPVRKKEMLDLLTGFLAELGVAGESAAEFLSLYQSLVQQSPWKQYLAVRGVLMYLAKLLTREIQELHRLEETTLTSDLAQGYALKMLTELMASFLEQDSIKQLYKGRLVGAVLNGYLSLRRLVVQRTRLIDETQEKLLELLEEMTTGTEAETKAFMAICIETVEKCSQDDVRTPVFVFERLCSIIYPEENDVGEFYLTLEKDPQQEDFLQGRMLGNPYSSNEPGLGPLMRDVKNKICQDCELVALLEDDNGMELLVNNKIISLDLPVREVYKKIWVAEGGEGDVMRVVYRMRGLLGDATEEFVETLTAKSEQEVDNEEVFKMANVMADCGGLQVMLKRLANINDTSRSRSLLQVLLKLLCLCVKVKRNVEVLIRPELGTVTALLNILQLCLADPSQTALTQQILDVMETVLSKVSLLSQEELSRFATTLGGPEHIRSLLEMTETCVTVRTNSTLLHHLTTVLAALTYGSQDKMAVLIDHFQPYPLDFNRFDLEHTPDNEQKMELFCNLTAGIDHTPLGNTLKDYIISLGIVDKALEYVSMHAPPVKPSLMRADSDEWKEYISKPSLKYIIRLLTGLATQHEPTQLAVAEECIPIIHRLEQVSSDEHVGSLAENLLEALRTNAGVANRIEEVREQTRAEKKRLAMAMREKQLGALGMRTNDKGQVTAESNILQQMEDLGEETGLVCVICREGYKFQPGKVLGIYTYTKRCNVDDAETKPRKTVGYSTVTHFNVVHVDCHMNAVRLARSRDEWESAALQNANTRCNGLLPLWGPHVPESAFASCLARHNTYLQECTSHRDISYISTVHDLKLLLLRFSQEKSFHEDAGGGGPQSNMHLIPYLLHMALYVINTTRCGGKEEKNLNTYLECASTERWIESSYEAKGPLYWATLSLCLHSPGRWRVTRLAHLRRLLVLAHVRPSNAHSISDPTPADYNVYKNILVFFGLVDIIYKQYFKGISVSSEEQWPTTLADYIRHNDETLLKCSERLMAAYTDIGISVSSEEQWPTTLADYIRHNDETLLKCSERLMAAYTDELLPATSFEEICDVLGFLNEITDPSTYIKDILIGLIS